jgi:uncharacterized protein
VIIIFDKPHSLKTILPVMTYLPDASIHVLNFQDYPAVPWKNGLGITREIFQSDLENNTFSWRLSLADVTQSGAYSTFNGIERIITLVEGAGYSLNFENSAKKTIDTLNTPYRFDGGAAVNCELFDGVCKNLNLMVNKDYIHTGWNSVAPAQSVKIEMNSAKTYLVFNLGQDAYLQCTNEKSPLMGKWGCARVTGASLLKISSDTQDPLSLFWVEL